MPGPRKEGMPEHFQIPSLSPEVTGTDTFEKLVAQLREVPSLGNKEFHPYRLSKFSLVEVPIDRLNPTALYVLNQKLSIQRALRESFLKVGVNTFNLTEGATLIRYNWGEKKKLTISPPLVEVSEDDGNLLLITDGLHRITVAKDKGENKLTVVLIENVACPLPVMPVGWNEVKRFDIVPPAFLKRRFRFQTPEEAYNWELKNYARFSQGFSEEGKYSFFRVLEFMVPQRLEFGKTPALETILSKGRDLEEHGELYHFLSHLDHKTINKNPIPERLLPLSEKSIQDLKREWQIEAGDEIFRMDMPRDAFTFQGRPYDWEWWEVWDGDPDFVQVYRLNIQPENPVKDWELVLIKLELRHEEARLCGWDSPYSYLLGWLSNEELKRLLLEAEVVHYSFDPKFIPENAGTERRTLISNFLDQGRGLPPRDYWLSESLSQVKEA